MDRIMNKEADRPRACVIVDPFSDFLGKYIRREAAVSACRHSAQ